MSHFRYFCSFYIVIANTVNWLFWLTTFLFDKISLNFVLWWIGSHWLFLMNGSSSWLNAWNSLVKEHIFIIAEFLKQKNCVYRIKLNTQLYISHRISHSILCHSCYVYHLKHHIISGRICNRTIWINNSLS